MTQIHNNLDVSDELRILKYGNGIKLIHPDQVILQNHSSIFDTGQTINSILKLPLDVYFYNTDHLFQKLNENSAESCGFNSVNEAVSKNLYHTSHKKYAKEIEENNKRILASDKPALVEEELVLFKNDVYRRCVTIKLPIYNEENKSAGVFGCSIICDRDLIAESISHLMQLGLLTPLRNTQSVNPIQSGLINNIYFSKRQMECLRLTVLGKTAKRIGQELDLSQRTVESYLEEIKIKVNVFTKAELIEKMRHYFL